MLNTMNPTDAPMSNPPTTWTTTSFAEVLKGGTPPPPIYTGEDEDDYMDDLGISNIMGDQEVIEDGELCPVADIPWESYKKSWLPW